MQQLVESQNYVLTSLTPQLVIASADFPVVPDIFDRLIVTEARWRDLPLVTRDRKIHESGIVETVWD